MLKRILGQQAVALIAAIIPTSLALFPIPLLATPNIVWSPTALATVIDAGDVQTVPISVTSSADITGAEIVIVPGLSHYVSVDPGRIDYLAAGESLDLELTISVPATTLPGELDGVLRVRSQSNGRTLARPLPIQIGVQWERVANDDVGVSIEYPDFGKDSSVVFTEIWEDTSLLEISIESSDLVSQVVLSFVDNPQGLSLSEWFSGNVDLGGFLSASGAFVLETLPNGMERLVLFGRIPPEHGDSYGPVSQVYATSPDGHKIILANLSHGNELALLGLDTEEHRVAYLTNIVSRLVFE